MFDHRGFAVADYTVSKSFFLKALEPLGVGMVMESEHGLGIGSKGQAVALAVPDCRKAAADAHRVRDGEAPAG